MDINFFMLSIITLSYSSTVNLNMHMIVNIHHFLYMILEASYSLLGLAKAIITLLFMYTQYPITIVNLRCIMLSNEAFKDVKNRQIESSYDSPYQSLVHQL